MTTFVHTADWQLGKPFAGVDDDHKRSLLRQERVAVIERIGAVAREHNASFIVVAGDLFDSPTATKAIVSDACAKIGMLGVPVLAIPGNHDHAGPGSVWLQPYFERERAALAPNLHILLAPEPVELDHAVIFPCPLLRRHEASDVTAWLRGTNAWADQFGQKPRIVLAHGSVQHFGAQTDDDDGVAPANLLDVSRISPDAYDYIALGDWHGTKQVGPIAWYSGTPEFDRFAKGGDHDPGHVLVVSASRGGTPSVECVRVARFGWHTRAFTFTDDASLGQLEQEVAPLIGSRANEDLLRLDLDGSLGIEATSRLQQLLEAWRARLLRVRLTDRVLIAPTEAELQALVQRAEDPLIARVAQALHTRATSGTDDADVARLALRELHAAVQSC